MTDEPPIPFETALAQLDKILRDLEDGSITLDESLARYERGIALLRQCYAQLKVAEQKITQLTGLTADGDPELKVFEHTASVEKGKARRTKTNTDD